MKVVTFIKKTNPEVGVLKNNGLEVVPVNYLGCSATDMTNFLEVMTPEKQEKLEKQKEQMNGFPLESVKLVSPFLQLSQDIICLGINYMDHAEESDRFHSESFAQENDVPIYFSKRVNKGIGHGEQIDGHFDIVDSVDYEVELGVIIGTDARNVSEADAHKYVFGYTIINDYSARNLQTKHKQWYFGKSLDDFTGIGPWIVTANEFASFPPDVKIQSYVNGELRQDSKTSLMINTIPQVIAELSKGMTLKAGTILSMGTPAGVGMGFEPPKFLNRGDVVRCEIEGIGTLEHTIK